MPATWVLVADSSAARIFAAPSPVGALNELYSYVHAEGRAHERDFRTDEPGVTHDSTGETKHGYAQRVQPKEQEAIAFARFLARQLEHARATSKIERIILVAPPEFLGHVRGQLDDATRALVEGEHSLDVVRFRAEDIRRHLPDRLFSAVAASK
jgi:protein required for attachment to host cells